MSDLTERVVRASSDAEAYKAALFLVFTAADTELASRVREVEGLVRQRDSLAKDTALLLSEESIGSTEVAREADVSPQYVSKLRHGRRIGHAKAVLVRDAAMRIVAARKQVG